MYNCIFSAYCTRSSCDKSCPTLAQTTYLLERNKISMNSPVFQAKESSINAALDALDKCDGKFGTWVSCNNPEGTADLFTYCAICQNWKGSQLHCCVYHLNFSRYIELIRNSWSANSECEELEYMKIWISTCKVLIISGFRYLRFNDFESQTMLNLIDTRMSRSKTTLVVTPDIQALVGNEKGFLCRLKQLLKEARIN